MWVSSISHTHKKNSDSEPKVTLLFKLHSSIGANTVRKAQVLPMLLALTKDACFQCKR